MLVQRIAAHVCARAVALERAAVLHRECVAQRARRRAPVPVPGVYAVRCRPRHSNRRRLWHERSRAGRRRRCDMSSEAVVKERLKTHALAGSKGSQRCASHRRRGLYIRDIFASVAANSADVRRFNIYVV